MTTEHTTHQLGEAPDPSGLPPLSVFLEAGVPQMPPLEAALTTEGLRKANPALRSVEIEDVAIDANVPARLYRRPGLDGRPLLVWAHGGAFIGGDLDMPEANWVALALAAADINVLSIDYRKALNGVCYPAPIDDVSTAWQWAVDHGEALGVGPLHLGGASAGASLAASVAMRLRDTDGLQPASMVLAYPSLHRELPLWPVEEVEGLRERAGWTYFSSSWIREVTANFLGDGGSDRGRYAFPGEGDVDGLPPHLVLLADNDTLRSSGVAYVDMLTAAGTPNRARVLPGSLHGFLNSPEQMGAQAGIKEIVDWMNTVDASTR